MATRRLFSERVEGAELDGVGRGGLFDGTTQQDITQAARRIETELAEDAVNRVQARLDVVLQNPTGFYRSRVRVARNQHGAVVTDSRVVYGPWLEGVSTRNAETRFKGYATFRRVAAEMETDGPPFARRILDRYLS